jgi:hypothetical protein
MDKDIINHKDNVLAKIHSITTDNSLVKIDKIKLLNLLYRYHTDKVKEFQHERIVHLFITLFFAALVILSATTMVSFSFSDKLYSSYLYQLLGIIFIIILIVEFFYIVYYYRLENGVQKLYKVTDQLEKEIIALY